MGEGAEIPPERIGGDIGDDDLGAAKHGGAARTDAGAGGDAVDRAAILDGQARGGAVAEVHAIAVEHEKGAQHAGAAALGEAADGVERSGEGLAGGDPFEEAALGGEEGVRVFARGDIARGAGGAEGLAAGGAFG